MVKIINGTCYNRVDLHNLTSEVIMRAQEAWSRSGGFGELKVGCSKVLFEYSQDNRIRSDRVMTTADDLTLSDDSIVSVICLPRRKFLTFSAVEEIAGLGSVPMPDHYQTLLPQALYLAMFNYHVRKSMNCPTTNPLWSTPSSAGKNPKSSAQTSGQSAPWTPNHVLVRVNKRSDPAEAKKAKLEALKIKYTWLMRRTLSLEKSANKSKRHQQEVENISKDLVKCVQELRNMMPHAGEIS